MSNIDRSIDEGFDEALRAGGVFGQHSAWHFCGKVWYAGGLFHDEIWRHHARVGVRTAATLRDLMRVVNDEFGWD